MVVEGVSAECGKEGYTILDMKPLTGEGASYLSDTIWGGGL